MGTYVAKLQIGNDISNQAAFADILYGTCTTSASAAIKDVTFDYVDRVLQGLQIRVKFIYGNTATSGVKLRFPEGSSIVSLDVFGDCVCDAGGIVSFTYDNDGTDIYWRVTSGGISSVIKNYVTNTTTETIGSITGDMVFKGTIGTSPATIQTLPATGYKAGWTYKVATAGTYAGLDCEIGDVIIAINDGPTTDNGVIAADWTIVQNNIDGAIFKDDNAFTNTHVIIADGTNGKVKDSGFTLGKSVPADAIFTDTNTAYEYTLVTNSQAAFTSCSVLGDNDSGTILASIDAGVLKLEKGIMFGTTTYSLSANAVAGPSLTT